MKRTNSKAMFSQTAAINCAMVSQFQGLGGSAHFTSMIRDVMLYFASLYTNVVYSLYVSLEFKKKKVKFIFPTTKTLMTACMEPVTPAARGQQGRSSPCPQPTGAKGARFSILRHTFGYFVCNLFTTKAPKTAFSGHLGILILKIFIWAQP